MGVAGSKNVLKKKRVFEVIEIKIYKRKHDKFSLDNLLKKCKGRIYNCVDFTLNKLIEIDLIKEGYKKIDIKNNQLRKIKRKQYIQNSGIQFNLKFFNQTLKEIYISYDISPKYKPIVNNKEYKHNINEDIIDKFSPKNNLFKQLIEKTFEECRKIVLMESIVFIQKYHFDNKYLLNKLKNDDEKKIIGKILQEGLGKQYKNKNTIKINIIDNDIKILNNLNIENTKNELNYLNIENSKNELNNLITENTKNELNNVNIENSKNKFNNLNIENSKNELKILITENTKNELNNVNIENTKNELNNLITENTKNELNNLITENTKNELNNLNIKKRNDEYNNLLIESDDFNIIEKVNDEFNDYEKEYFKNEILKSYFQLNKNFQDLSTSSRSQNENNNDNDFKKMSYCDKDKLNDEDKVKFDTYLEKTIIENFLSDNVDK